MALNRTSLHSSELNSGCRLASSLAVLEKNTIRLYYKQEGMLHNWSDHFTCHPNKYRVLQGELTHDTTVSEK